MLPPSLRTVVVWTSLGVATLAGAVLACSGTTSDAAKTITGVVIRAETLTTGRGCGTGTGQVYKYAAVVAADEGVPGKPDFSKAPVATSVFDCFADGAFVSLPPSSTGSTSYRLQIYIYDQADYAPVAGAITSQPTNPDAYGTPTWSTTCFATQVDQVQSLAVCDPIQFGKGGIGGDGSASIQLPTTSFARANGGSIACAFAPAADGGAGDAGDAGDDGGDAGADAGDAAPPIVNGAGYGDVRVTPSVVTVTGAKVTGAPTTTTCPNAFTIPGAVPLQTYSLAVELLSPDGGAVVGATTCSATARAGATTVPTCVPVP